MTERETKRRGETGNGVEGDGEGTEERERHERERETETGKRDRRVGEHKERGRVRIQERGR